MLFAFPNLGGRTWRRPCCHAEEGEGLGTTVGERARGEDQLCAREARARDKDHQLARDGVAVRRRGASFQVEEGSEEDEGPPQGCSADDRTIKVRFVKQSCHEAIEEPSKLSFFRDTQTFLNRIWRFLNLQICKVLNHFRVRVKVKSGLSEEISRITNEWAR